MVERNGGILADCTLEIWATVLWADEKETPCVDSGEGDVNKLQWITKLGLCQLGHVTCLEFSVMVSFLYSGYIS